MHYSSSRTLEFYVEGVFLPYLEEVCRHNKECDTVMAVTSSVAAIGKI